MGCSLSRAPNAEQCWQKPLSPRATAPPPPPLTSDSDSDSASTASRSRNPATVHAGLGASSAANAAVAARQALAKATESLAAAALKTGRSPKPSIAIVASNKAMADAEEVRCTVVRALPDALLHGATSVASLFSSYDKAEGGNNTRQCSESRADAVQCLLLEAPEGSFAAAWDDTGDALYAARWLQEQMPDVQAVIMATVPGQEDSALRAIQSVFPGVLVYGSSVSKDTNWVTMSHLGSAERGISLVGIGRRVSFGAAEIVPRDNADLSASLSEVYEAAMAAGGLKTASAGILTCRGHPVDICTAQRFGYQMGNIPVLGLASTDQTHSLRHEPSIGIMLFGERHPKQERDIGMNCSAEDDVMSASTAWPLSPATDVSLCESAIDQTECGSDVPLLGFAGQRI